MTLAENIGLPLEESSTSALRKSENSLL